MLRQPHFTIDRQNGVTTLALRSDDGTNRLTRACVRDLTDTIAELARTPEPLILTGNDKFFSAGADLTEIAALDGPEAYQFSVMGQSLMNAVENFPASVYAAIRGYCMGGGLDLALSCRHRIAGPHAIFGHRGAALGLITGWGGTQRLPRLLGKGGALEMFVAAEKLHAGQALQVGLIDAISQDPVEEAKRRIAERQSTTGPPAGSV